MGISWYAYMTYEVLRIVNIHLIKMLNAECLKQEPYFISFLCNGYVLALVRFWNKDTTKQKLTTMAMTNPNLNWISSAPPLHHRLRFLVIFRLFFFSWLSPIFFFFCWIFFIVFIFVKFLGFLVWNVSD